MTLAQKKARENFKKAIAYRKKTGCSLKQAFAHVKGKKVGATKVIERGENKNAKVTKVLQRVRSKKGTFKGMKKVSGGTHKDTKSHNVNIRVVSGVKKYKKITGVPQYKDPDAAREIELYADSNGQLYYSRRKPILLNLQKKYKAGKYNVELAAKLWLYYINDAMQRYNKEFGSRKDKWSDLLSVSDRKLLAYQYAIDTKNEFDLGNFII